MMAHHIITVILMVTSYAYNFTRFGCVVMVLMDCCDIFLPVSDPQTSSMNDSHSMDASLLRC